jgi:hypothetical protein
VLAQSESGEEVPVEEAPTPVQAAAPVSQTSQSEGESSSGELVINEGASLAIEPEAISNQEIMIIESPIISTSSGLAVANITTDNPSHAGATTVASFATKPNALLQFVYLGLGLLVFLLLTASLVMEARQLRFVQVAYSVLLLFGMGGLWFINSLLTSGAVII